MGALGGDTAVLEEQDPVGESDRGQAVGDHEQRVPTLGSKVGEDGRLDHRIDGGRGVVEQEHPGSSQERPRQGETLALTA